MRRCEILEGDCRDLMAALEPDSVDAIVTDPPYGLEFMGKDWDRFDARARIRQPSERDGEPGAAHNGTTFLAARNVPDAYVAGSAFQQWSEAWAREAYRVLKPGGHLLAFGGARTYHRLACGLEGAGFEIRDQIMWLYGSGFPKSLDVSKAIDAAAGAEREIVGTKLGRPGMAKDGSNQSFDSSAVYGSGGVLQTDVTAPATDSARRWHGWGTALKPAHEPIAVARKPLIGTVASNVEAHGTGALNIDGCRIEAGSGDYDHPGNALGRRDNEHGWRFHKRQIEPHAAGRWPANVVLDEAAGAMLDAQTGRLAAGASPPKRGLGSGRVYGARSASGVDRPRVELDAGGASRFFYCPKADRTERDSDGGENDHPTVKPVDLMRWLVRLVTPPGGLVLDPFAGSGSTGVACSIESFDFLGMEKDPGYAAIARSRILDAPLGLGL